MFCMDDMYLCQILQAFALRPDVDARWLLVLVHLKLLFLLLKEDFYLDNTTLEGKYLCHFRLHFQEDIPA